RLGRRRHARAVRAARRAGRARAARAARDRARRAARDLSAAVRRRLVGPERIELAPVVRRSAAGLLNPPRIALLALACANPRMRVLALIVAAACSPPARHPLPEPVQTGSGSGSAAVTPKAIETPALLERSLANDPTHTTIHRLANGMTV